jgi:myosin heavy subunit
MFTPGNFEGTQLAGTKEVSDLDFASSFAPNSPDANPTAQTEKASSESVMNTLAEMNKIIRSEQDAKSEYQMRITELSFALEQKRIREEESRAKIANLEDLTKELQARQELLQEQKETVESSLRTAKEQLRRVQDVTDRKNNSKVKALQQQIQEMNNSLQQAKTLNSEYEISLKRIGNQRRDEEDAKRVALEERDYLENALRKARADLEKHRRAQEEAEEQQRAALRRAEEEAEHHRQIQLDLERQQALVKKSKEDLEKEYKVKVALFEEQQAAFKKLEEELQQQKQMFQDLQKQQDVLIQSSSDQRGAQGDQRQDEWRQEKERLEKQVQSQNELQQRQQAALRRAKEELESQRKVQQDLERQIAELKTGGNLSSPIQASQAGAPLRRASSATVSSSRSPPQRTSFSPINEDEDRVTRSPPSPMRRQSSANMSSSQLSNMNGFPSTLPPVNKVNTPSKDVDVNADSQIEALKAELLKEMALLKEIDTMREGMKDEIKNWMDNFAARNGRAPTVEERAPVAPRYQAYKEVTF